MPVKYSIYFFSESLDSPDWTCHISYFFKNLALTWLGMSPSNYKTYDKQKSLLTHWGRVTHICISKLTIIGSDNGLSPGRRQAIIWTIAGILLIWPYGTNFSEILIGIQTFSFKKMHLKMSSGKWRPFCPGLNVLNKAWRRVFLRCKWSFSSEQWNVLLAEAIVWQWNMYDKIMVLYSDKYKLFIEKNISTNEFSDVHFLVH